MQDAFAAMYLILQRYSSGLCVASGIEAALASAADVAVLVLQETALLREAAAAAATMLWAAFDLPGSDPAYAAQQLAEGLCERNSCKAAGANGSVDASGSLLQQRWQRQVHNSWADTAQRVACGWLCARTLQRTSNVAQSDSSLPCVVTKQQSGA
jgi:hypothetical protein